MRYRKEVYITIDWHEQGLMEANSSRFHQQGRKVTDRDYPEKLPCHNPECRNGGFEIGSRIAALLASGQKYEQNSLICSNAIHSDKNQRCLHTISYSISCIYPHGQETSRPLTSDLNAD